MIKKNRGRKKTLYQWLDEWYPTCTANIQESTSRCYRITIGIIHRWFPDIPLCSLTSESIQDTFQRMAEQGCSKSSIRKVRIVLHQVFKLAIRKNLVSYDATEYVAIPRGAKEADVLPLSIRQQRCVERACQDDPYGDLMIFLLYTGLRLSELCNLQWKDFDPEYGILHIRKSKTDAGIRAIPLLPEIAAIVKKQPRINAYIFNSPKTKCPITPTIMHRTYLRLREQTGVLELTNHVCRHTFATRLIERGASPAAVAALMGHTNVAFTFRQYVKAQPEFLREQMSLLSQQSQLSQQTLFPN